MVWIKFTKEFSYRGIWQIAVKFDTFEGRNIFTVDKFFPRLADFIAVFQALNIQIIEDLFSKVAESEKYFFHAAVLSVNWTNKQNIIAHCDRSKLRA